MKFDGVDDKSMKAYDSNSNEDLKLDFAARRKRFIFLGAILSILLIAFTMMAASFDQPRSTSTNSDQNSYDRIQ